MSSFSEIQEQIKSLQQQADAIKAAEINDVITDIKAKIELYGLTADDLGLALGNKAKELAQSLSGVTSSFKKQVSATFNREKSGDEATQNPETGGEAEQTEKKNWISATLAESKRIEKLFKK